ncbi:uncharacterized protein DS421_14g460920 [Arachis hypogaea]|nr:uncharacterized protein DS421_14g460920 [Arachis hypogaea]
MMAFAFFSFPGSPFHVTQHLLCRPGKATCYMEGALALHFMSLNRSSQALHSMSLKDDIFSCCSVSWVPMMAAMKSFSLPYNGDMLAITGHSRIHYTANEICMVSNDSQQCLHNITPWKEHWKITVRVIKMWSLCDPREETDEPAFLHIMVMDKSIQAI